MNYQKAKKYTLKYLNSNGETKELEFTPEKDMSTPEMIMKLKTDNNDFFKLLEEGLERKTYPKKIKTRDGYVLTKVNDGTPENAGIPEYMNEYGDCVLISDPHKYLKVEETTEINQEKEEFNQKLIQAMKVLGFYYDDINSYDTWLVFNTEAPTGSVTFNSWSELEEWINGVVIDDPEEDKAVNDILNKDDEPSTGTNIIDKNKEVSNEKSIKELLSEIIEKDAKEEDYYFYNKTEWDDLDFEDKFYEWNEHNYLEDYYDELGIELYNGSLELSSNPVMNYINNESFEDINSEELSYWYWEQVDQWLANFQEKMQQQGLLDGEITYDGRSSRHIIIDNCLTNILNYAGIKDAYQKLENDFIEYMNNYTFKEEDE